MKSYNDKKSGRYIIFRMLASEKKFFEYDNMNQWSDQWVVLMDPAGHPFCFVI
jgi:hypothetical protein